MAGDLDSVTHFPSYTKRDAFSTATIYLICIPSKLSKIWNCSLSSLHADEKEKSTHFSLLALLMKEQWKTLSELYYRYVVQKDDAKWGISPLYSHNKAFWTQHAPQLGSVSAYQNLQSPLQDTLINEEAGKGLEIN